MVQKCRGKRNVVRNEKWLRDMYRIRSTYKDYI